MRDRRDPWKWPFVVATTLAVSALLVFAAPRSWFVFQPYRERGNGMSAQRNPWLRLRPPPEIEPAASPAPPPESTADERLDAWQDAPWWTEAWAGRIVAVPGGPPRYSRDDSVRVVLARLGLDADFTAQVRPDSQLAARLLILRREDSLRFETLKPYWAAMSRVRSYADMMSRAAAMYDEFLAGEIIAPDDHRPPGGDDNELH